MSKEFGDRLRSRRKECEMTTTACAAALGVTQPAWNQWELGVREPKLEMLSKIAKLLDVKVDWLLGLDERGTSAAPGDSPDCKACPHMAKLRKLEEIMGK